MQVQIPTRADVYISLSVTQKELQATALSSRSNLCTSDRVIHVKRNIDAPRPSGVHPRRPRRRKLRLRPRKLRYKAAGRLPP